MKGKSKKKITLQPSRRIVSDVIADEIVATAPTLSSPRPRTVETKSLSLISSQSERKAILLVLVITLAVYLTALGGGFVYDDSFQVLKNPTLASAGNIPAMFTQGVWQFMNSNSSQSVGLYYRPLFNSLLIVNYQLFGLAPFGWHLVSVLLHLVVTYLVFRWLRAWQQPREVALLAALLFGVHPVHSESVAWVSGVPDPLAAMFVLLALIIHERAQRPDSSSLSAGAKWQALSIVAGLLALFTKEVAIVLVAVVVLREWFREATDESFSARLKRVALRTAPFLIAVFCYLAARLAVLGFISKAEPKAVGITATQVWLTLPSILFTYIRMLFAPYPLAVIYDIGYVNAASQAPFWYSLLLLVVILIASVVLLRRSTRGWLAWGWTLLFLLPVLNLKAFNPQESIVHDRYLYLPSAGFCWLLALGLWWLYQRFAAQQKLVLVAVVILTLVLSGLTFAQNLTWQDDQTLTTHALSYAPRHPFLLNLLGAYHSERNNTAEAIKYYQQALAAKPDYDDALSNLGSLYYKQNNLAEAEKYYAQAVTAGARHTQTLYNLADARGKQGKYAEAEQPLLQAIAEQANYAEAHYYLGWIYQQQAKYAQADTAYRNALLHKPALLEARINLATVMNEQGRLKEAEDLLNQVKQAQPTHPVMLYTFGEVYRKSNRIQEAVATLTQLTSGRPQHQEGWVSLAQCYEQMGDPSLARATYQRAIDLASQSASASKARERLANLP